MKPTRKDIARRVRLAARLLKQAHAAAPALGAADYQTFRLGVALGGLAELAEITAAKLTKKPVVKK